MKRFAIGLTIIAAAITGYVLSYPVLTPSFSGGPNGQGTVGGEQIESVQPFVAVVLDNSPEARPGYGLSNASIVFETVAEGGITRMIAFFDEKTDVARIGPVRSARPYFVDWTYGSGTGLAHSGGSREGLNKIASLGSAFQDINEFSAEHYFWRDAKKPAPHNLFTSTELLKSYFDNKLWPKNQGEFGWAISNEPATGATSTEVLIDFSYPQFAAKFQYDTASKNYLRFLGGVADKDGINGTQIAAKNVVVLYTTSTVIDRKLLTVDLQTLGSGRAVIFTGGKVMQARWQKPSDSAPLRLLDADGSVITLSPGQTWVEVIDQTGTAVWK